ncbi:MAG: hypothetical protein ACQESG_01000 [Nanobdellota archaeon]
METVELVVYLMISILVAGIVLQFVISSDLVGIYEEAKPSQTQQDLQPIEPQEFVERTMDFWVDSGMCMKNASTVFYVEGTTVNKTVFFDVVKAMNKCDTIHSQSHDCGNNEHLKFPNQITLPSLIRVVCNSSQLIVES